MRASHSLTLIDLGQILAEFKHTIELEDSTFELVSFHSCSVSSIEVAYELQGTAKYMLASQGPAFVGSWPYRQILVRIFNALAGNAAINMRDLMYQIHRSCMLNSADYLLAGYSFQLTLCDLEKVSTIKDSIDELARTLTAGLKNEPANEQSIGRILLSHWKSQSFFNEMYTDLYDFCFCLSNKIKEFEAGGKTTQGTHRHSSGLWQRDGHACEGESEARWSIKRAANYCCLRFIGTGISVFAWAVSLFSMGGAFKRQSHHGAI